MGRKKKEVKPDPLRSIAKVKQKSPDPTTPDVSLEDEVPPKPGPSEEEIQFSTGRILRSRTKTVAVPPTNEDSDEEFNYDLNPSKPGPSGNSRKKTDENSVPPSEEDSDSDGELFTSSKKKKKIIMSRHR